MSKNGVYKSRAWLACVLALWILAAPLHAKTIAAMESKEHDLIIALTDDACGLKDEITNLPKRAVWIQAGKEVEGCYGVTQQFGVVIFYFADKTATSIPIPFFHSVENT